MSIIKHLWLLMCLGGNVVQIYQIASLFFSFAVLTKVFLTYPERTHLPSLSLCFYFGDIIKWDELFDKFPDFKEKLEYSDKSIDEIKSEFRNYTHDDKLRKQSAIISTLTSSQIMNITESIPSYVFRSILMNQSSLAMDVVDEVSLLWKSKEYLRECFKCVSFDNGVGDGLYTYRDIFLDGKSNGFAFEISFNETMLNRTNRVLAMLHIQWQYPRSGQTKSIPIRDLSKLFVFKYIIYISKLLPAPYPTDCTDYMLISSEDAGHCYELCARNESLKALNNKIFPGPVVESGYDYGLLSIMNQTEETYKKIKDIKKSCSKACSKKNCTDYVITPYLGSSKDFDKMVYDVYFPNQPNIVTDYSPYLSWLAFIVSTLSTIGFWLGFSVLDAESIAYDFIGKHFGKKNQNDKSGSDVEDKEQNVSVSEKVNTFDTIRRRKSSLVNHIIKRSQDAGHPTRMKVNQAPKFDLRPKPGIPHWRPVQPYLSPIQPKVTFETRHQLPRLPQRHATLGAGRHFDDYVSNLIARSFEPGTLRCGICLTGSNQRNAFM